MRSHRISRLAAVWALATAAACSPKAGPETSPVPSAPSPSAGGGARTITLEALEARRKACAVNVESLGVFSALDVPTRVGPVWSRRSGS